MIADLLIRVNSVNSESENPKMVPEIGIAPNMLAINDDLGNGCHRLAHFLGKFGGIEIDLHPVILDAPIVQEHLGRPARSTGTLAIHNVLFFSVQKMDLR